MSGAGSGLEDNLKQEQIKYFELYELSVECWEATECYDWCSVTSSVNVTISGGNGPRVIKEPVGYHQTGFIIMESRLPHCPVDPLTSLFSLTRNNSLSQFPNFSGLVLRVVHELGNHYLPIIAW